MWLLMKLSGSSKEYQKEKIPEEFCKICKADNVEKKPRQSYWKQAYLQLQMPTESAEEENIFAWMITESRYLK